ncbi:MAG: SgcJ/EcaC family oxidoreductase [Arenicella sp.]
MRENDILHLFDEWNRALLTRDPKKIAALYDDKSILLPTISNKVRHNRAEIEEYFVRFLANAPEGKIEEANVRIFDHLAINSGVYKFTFNDDTIVKARFTFVYRWTGERWVILEHHSSQMPE